MGKEKIKTLLVDDEKNAIRLLQLLLKDYPEIEVVATADNALDAYMVILEEEPDLVFLDIQMPRETGLELSEKLKALPSCPAVIFVTAYDQFAISAIKNAALDYILKPVSRSDLKEAMDRFRHMKYQEEMNHKLNQFFAQLTYPPKLKFNTRTGFIMIDPEKIIFCKAEGNYTEIFTSEGKKEIITSNLGHLEKSLSPEFFYRISRFNIVNLNFITRINRKDRFCEVGVNGTTYKLPLPKNKIRELEDKLSEHS